MQAGESHRRDRSDSDRPRGRAVHRRLEHYSKSPTNVGQRFGWLGAQPTSKTTHGERARVGRMTQYCEAHADLPEP
jgi:hypothetical protein